MLGLLFGEDWREGTLSTRLGSALVVLDARPGLRAVDYLRVSTEQQRNGYGIAYTGKATRKYIDKKAWVHVRTFSDEGESGTLPWWERPGAEEIMDLARSPNRPFDVVVVHESRAVGRQNRVFWEWVWILRDLGVFVAIVEDDIDNLTQGGEAAMQDKANEAFRELIRIRDRTQGGIQEKAEDGGHPGGAAPWGWRIENRGVRGESCFAVDDREWGEAICARRARVLFLANRNWRKSAEQINAEGFRDRSGNLWTHNNLRGRMLSETLLTAKRTWRGRNAITGPDGVPLYGKQVVQELPPVFTPEEAAELRTAADGFKVAPCSGVRFYSLKKRLMSPCGQWYVGQAFRDSPALYRCRAREESTPGAKDGCNCPSVDAETTEKEAWRLIRGVLEDPPRLEAMVRDRLAVRAQEGAAAGRRVAGLENVVAELESVLALTTTSVARQAHARGLSGEAAQSFMDRVLSPLTKELAEMQKQLQIATEWLRGGRESLTPKRSSSVGWRRKPEMASAGRPCGSRRS